jgi:hypothetical protein
MALTLTQELILRFFEEEDLIIKTQTHLVRVDKATRQERSYTPTNNNTAPTPHTPSNSGRSSGGDYGGGRSSGGSSRSSGGRGGR